MPYQRRPNNKANALSRPPRCLRSSAFFDADFRSQPKAFSFRCRQLRPASFDACLHHRRLQSALLSLLTCHRRLGTSRAPASFNADARRHSCHPPPCASCDAPFIGQPRCLNRSASLDAHDPSALPCSRSRTFSCVRLSDLDRAHLSTLTITTAARCTRPHTCSGHALRRYRTHSLRAFIFSVLSSRKFGSSVSVRTILLELSSLPTRASLYGIASVFARALVGETRCASDSVS